MAEPGTIIYYTKKNKKRNQRREMKWIKTQWVNNENIKQTNINNMVNAKK